jgi:hypothetical protein
MTFLSRPLLLIGVAVFGTVPLAAARDTCDPRQLSVNLVELDAPESIRQIVAVTSDSWSSAVGILNKFELRDGRWCEIDAALPVVLGRRGSAWGSGLHKALGLNPQKVEGDGPAARAPISLPLRDADGLFHR